jgi:Zn-dependent peptidase ImmA (M78 family)
MALPEKIKVGPIILSVIATPDTPIDENGLHVLGQYDSLNSIIYILSTTNYQVQVESLIHELCHAIMDESGLAHNKQPVNVNDEQIIQGIAGYLHQVLMDNDFSFVRRQKSKENKEE